MNQELESILVKYKSDCRRIWLDETMDICDNEALYQALYEHFVFNTAQMPYGTAKARDGDPAEWIFQKLMDGDLGVEVIFVLKGVEIPW